MATLTMSQKEKILKTAIPNLYNSTKLNFPDRPPIERYITEGYNAWFMDIMYPILQAKPEIANIFAYMPINDTGMFYLTTDSTDKHHLIQEEQIAPNIGVSYSRSSYHGRERCGDTNFFIAQRNPEHMSFSIDKALLRKEVITGFIDSQVSIIAPFLTEHKPSNNVNPIKNSESRYFSVSRTDLSRADAPFLPTRYMSTTALQEIHNYNKEINRIYNEFYTNAKNLVIAISNITTENKFKTAFPKLKSLIEDKPLVTAENKKKAAQTLNDAANKIDADELSKKILVGAMLK